MTPTPAFSDPGITRDDAPVPSSNVPKLPDCPMTPEAEQFVAKHRLHDELGIAVALARENFSPDQLYAELSEDPSSDDSWIVLRIKLRGTVESTLAAKGRYTAKWVESVPWQRRFLIRLSYHIVD